MGAAATPDAAATPSANLTDPGMADVGPVTMAWAFNPAGFEALLARLKPHGRVLFLSGDVHYGLTSALDYWVGAGPPARYVQAVCSAFQNENDPVQLSGSFGARR